MEKIFRVFAAALFALTLWMPAAQAAERKIEPINLKEIQSFVETGNGQKVLFVYASWCPYCKKQMEGFKLFRKDHNYDNILAVAIDGDAAALKAYLAPQADFPFDAYHYTGGDELEAFIKKQGGSFNGGIPYFAVFEKGKFVKEFVGVTHPKELVEPVKK